MRKSLLIIVLSACGISMFAQEEWKVPEKARSLKSSFSLDEEKMILKGEKIFGKTCWTCHGEEGKGDGAAAELLDPKPADLSSEMVQQQSDGALFWKITEGRGNMVGYEQMLSDEQRWQLVAFIRSLAQNEEE